MYDEPAVKFVPTKLRVAPIGVYESVCTPTLVIVVVPVGKSWKFVTAEFENV
jgi:hypothetical protein